MSTFGRRAAGLDASRSPPLLLFGRFGTTMRHRLPLLWGWLFALLLVANLVQAEPVEVTLMLRPQKPAFAQFQELARRFNERNPDIHFRIIATDISQKMHL